MRKIKIFLASSIGELKMDRLAISEATLELNNELIEQDIRLQLFMCEHYDTSITAIGKQNEYNNFIRQPCDIFINLYHNDLGAYTLEEYETAIETREQYGFPYIYIFVKNKNYQTSTSIRDFCDQAELRGVSVQNYLTLNEVAELYRQSVISFMQTLSSI
ncbi:MAG: hypothetical protein PHQ55_08115 [Eubacteriales bacterium]|nr:hypothetical protein [Eubacteriales bacterium]